MNYEIISISEVKAMVALDYSKPTERDIQQSYIMLNIWANMFAEYNESYSFQLCYLLKTKGLSHTICLANDAATCIILDQHNSSLTVFSSLIREVTDQLSMCRILELLRFPKRFAYLDNGSLAQETYNKFWDNNKRIKIFDRSSIPYWLQRRIRYYSNRLFGNWKKYRTNTFRIPSGAVYSMNAKTAVNKLIDAYRDGIQWYEKLPLVTKIAPRSQRYAKRWIRDSLRTWRTNTNQYLWKQEVTRPDNRNRLVDVPKSSTSRRIIGVEQTERQLLLGQIEDALRKCIDLSKGRTKASGRVVLTNQDRNRDMARVGSTNRSLCTIDFSAASDSISANFLSLIIPNDLYNEIMELRAWETDFNDTTRFLNVMVTMGTRVTFPLESGGFWILMLVTHDILNGYGVKTNLDDYSVYGDDCIVPYAAYDTFIDLATLCGFLPNQEKSFKDCNYRESCGVECYYGYDLTSHYWPRGGIDPTSADETELISLIELQHRISQHYRASAFLESYILSKKPGVAYTQVGHDSYSLWREFPVLDEKTVVPGRLVAKGQPQCAGTATALRVTRAKTVYSNYKVTDLEYDVASLMAYHHFLEYGPQYEDPLSELLGVSSRIDINQYLRIATTKLKNYYEIE